MKYESIINNIVPAVQYIITGVQPKDHTKRTPADINQTECYYCWRTKNARKHQYYVEQGTLVKVLDNGMAEIEVLHNVKKHPDITDRVTHTLYLDEFGNTPEQAVENKL